MGNAVLNLAARAARWLPAPVKRALYRVKPLARLIRSSLNRSAPSGLNEVEIAAGKLAGMHFLLDLHTEKDYWLGTYEPEMQAALVALVRPGMVAYDVGANIGYVTHLMAALSAPTGQVHAFEALPANVERLRHNLERNGLAGEGAHRRVVVVAAAVIDAPRPVHFLIGPSHAMGKAEGSAGRTEVTYTGQVEVPGISLDDYIFAQGNPPPQLVKIDIEGGEVLALPGMRRVLNEARPIVLIELHGFEAGRVAWQAFTSAGYRICRMAEGFPAVHSLEELDKRAYLAAFPGEARA